MRPEQVVEAALFVSTDPIPIETLRRISGLGSEEELLGIVEDLRKLYEERDSAIEIRRVGDAYIMEAKGALAIHLTELVRPVVPQQVLKTLSFIAMKQPVTQAEVVKARGDSAYAHVKELLGKGFIAAEPSGRTKLLTTTQRFADYFGLQADLVELKGELGRMLGGEKPLEP